MEQAAQDPRALGAARLAESGLDMEHSKLLGLKFLTPEQTKSLNQSFSERPSMQLPYFDISGKPTGFYRIRYLGKANGFEGAIEKPRRYAQAPGTQPELYIPPVGVPWKNILQMPGQPLWITEGEIKAASTCLHGAACLGLGGVWSWKSAKAGVELLPALEEFIWEGRDVFLAFDSDLKTNPQVLKALLAFGRALIARGARMRMVEIPDGRGGAKQGLDDFLMRYKSESTRIAALAELGLESALFSHSKELWALNAEVAFVKDPGLIVLLDTGRTMSPREFKESQYSNKFYAEIKVDKAGNQTVTDKPIADAWMKWKCRAELERMAYTPGGERITFNREYNSWSGWGCSPKRGDASLWGKLLDYMFAGDKAARKWFEQWCAWPIQHPGDKMYTAAVVWGVATGTGKSLIGYSLMRIYGKNSSEITDQDIEGAFNEWATNKQFVMGDDVAGSEHRRVAHDRLKAMITRQELRVNKKFQPVYSVRDCLNYYFNSNHPDAFVVEDADRRYFVWEAPAETQEREFYKEYDAWMRSESGPSALFYHLLHLDLSDFDPKARALETQAKLDMMLDSKSDAGAWVRRLREDPDSMLKLGGVALSGDLFTNARLLSLYDPEGKKKLTANGLGREMKRAGFRQAFDGRLITTLQGQQRYYAVRNCSKWLKAGLKEIQSHLKQPDDKERKY